MSDQFDPPDGDPPARPAAGDDPPAPENAGPAADSSVQALAKAEALPEDRPYPWDEQACHAPGMAADVRGTSAPAHDPPPEDPDAPRERHDAFTEARKSVWLRALIKTGCILDACRLTGVSPRTIYRHQERDPAFFDHCRIALRISGTPAEITAWQRAVEGVEQPFACGGEVHVRRRYSDGLLRLLLQGSNPKKYGANPGFRRKRLLRHERKQIEREVRAELEAKNERWTFDDAIKLLGEKLDKTDFDGLHERYAPGWTKTEDGHWIPPGYGPIPGWQPPAGPEGDDAAGGRTAAGAGDLVSGEDAPRDSV